MWEWCQPSCDAEVGRPHCERALCKSRAWCRPHRPAAWSVRQSYNFQVTFGNRLQVCWTSGLHLSVCKGWRSSPPASPWSGSLTTLRLSSGALFLSQFKIVLSYKSLPFLSRALDAGACGIVAPMINNREDAQRLVDQCRYLPPYLYLPVPVVLYVPGTQSLHSRWHLPECIPTSPGTLLKASVPGARQEPLLEISPHSRPTIMSRWGHPIFHLLPAFNQIPHRCLPW